MIRSSFVLLFGCSVFSLSAQISNDSLHKILNGTSAQISYYTKTPKLFNSLALSSITFHLEILKSVYAYKYENNAYHKKVRNLDSSLMVLKNKTNFVAPDSSRDEKVISQVEHLFKKRESELIGLTLENQNLRKQNYLLQMDTLRWSERCKRNKENEKQIKEHSKTLEKRIKLYEHGTYWGLSLGFNYFLNNHPIYYIKPDSTIGKIGAPKGVSFLISAIVGYKFNEKHSFIFNVPLGDFTRNSENAIGLFNQKLAGGLGYGYHISGVSIIGIINISPYEKMAPELLNRNKIEGEAYSVIDLNNYPTGTAYSPSFTIGMSYNFLGKPVLNTTSPE